MRKGFTLLELLIVVIVIGILAGVAIPQYLAVVERGKVAAAKNNLAIAAQAQKMYRTEHTAYAGNFTDLDNWAEGISAAITAHADDWNYSITDAADTFTITATREGAAGSKYGGKTVTINETNHIGGDHDFH